MSFYHFNFKERKKYSKHLKGRGLNFKRSYKFLPSNRHLIWYQNICETNALCTHVTNQKCHFKSGDKSKQSS